MKILVDEMPKEAKECLFYKNVCFGRCSMNDKLCVCKNGKCRKLKEYRPAEGDCK